MPSLFAPTDNPLLFAILVVLNMPLYWVVGRRSFGNAAEWKASVLDAFRVSHIVAFREFKDRPWLGARFWRFFIGCFVMVAIEYAIFSAFIWRSISGVARN
jgi:hypothetical protein